MTTKNSPPSSSESPGSSAFERFHEGVRRWIWDQGWQSLRPIQERAADPILRGDTDVIISAPTAGGKTEAAFLPIASRLAEDGCESVGALCVSPLKALINDQADRLTPLFERVNLPLTPWHGDVTQGRKQKLLRERRGVLLITPESLEALFVLRGSEVSDLFRDLRYVVVDELHTFIGSERGRQLQSLLNRVELAIRKRVPRVALSATLGDMALAAEALRPRSATDVVLIEGEGDGRELQMLLRGYIDRAPELEKPPFSDSRLGRGSEQLVPDLFECLRGKDNLVFANSRMNVEELTDHLRQMCDRQRLPNEFLAHHGNLAREIREEAEQRVKDRSRPTSVVCTSTLELGIDIGSVASIAQVGAPPSAAALRQRLGRSGRRGDDPAVLRIFIKEEEIQPTSNLMDELRIQLVQSIAMVQLLLARWCEPPAAGRLHLSTLVQQILSVIAQHGGASARDLYRVLCQSGPFQGVDSEVFAQLLRSMARHYIVTQTSDGGLTLGDRGEKLVDHYSFYTAFVTPEEYRLVAGGQTLGTMPITQPLSPGGHLIFAGRRWEIVRVEDESRVVELVPAKGGRPPRFAGSGFDVHDRIREEMRRIYSSSWMPVYLDATAKKLLAEGRAAFQRLDLSRSAVLEDGDTVYLFPWRGDRVMHTLMLQLISQKVRAAAGGIALVVQRETVEDLTKALGTIASGAAPSGPMLALLAHNQLEEKYDWTLSPELRALDYASRHFDEAGARESATQILGAAHAINPA